jgi:hypothetical protein
MQQNYNLHTTQMASVMDVLSVISGSFYDYFQMLLSATHPPIGHAAELVDDPSSYDPRTRSWKGEGNLSYRIPVTPLPSEAHTRYKIRNIKILMDNCRRLCVNDELPATPEEKRFWTMYGFHKQQNFISAFFWIFPPLYLFCKVTQMKLPEAMRGRIVPLVLALSISEQLAESWYPGHNFLCTALQAKTPLGDAARAEWQRLQPVSIPYQMYCGYQFQCYWGKINPEYLLGGDIRKLLKY